MTNLVSKCNPFCEYGMKENVFIPETIYDDF